MVKLKPQKPIKLTSKSKIIGHAKTRKIADILLSLTMPELFPKGSYNNHNRHRVHGIKEEIKMENVVSINSQNIVKPHSKYNNIDDEWDTISNIFVGAIKRKKLSKLQVSDMITKIKSEVRGKK